MLIVGGAICGYEPGVYTLALAQAGGCETTVVLSKADLIEDVEPLRERVHATLGEDLDVIALSVVGGRGLEGVEARMADGETAAILGSSGVGKSTLVNALLGEERFATQGVRKGDQKGRHTTSHRELVFRDDGSALIDTPGMRELQLWGTVEDVDEAFVDVFEAAQGCRFRDCRHLEEPGCGVRDAVKSGGL